MLSYEYLGSHDRYLLYLFLTGQIVLGFCTNRVNDTEVLSVLFTKDLNLMDEGDFVRFEFKTSFKMMPHIAMALVYCISKIPYVIQSHRRLFVSLVEVFVVVGWWPLFILNQQTVLTVSAQRLLLYHSKCDIMLIWEQFLLYKGHSMPMTLTFIWKVYAWRQ